MTAYEKIMLICGKNLSICSSSYTLSRQVAACKLKAWMHIVRMRLHGHTCNQGHTEVPHLQINHRTPTPRNIGGLVRLSSKLQTETQSGRDFSMTLVDFSAAAT